MTEEELQQMQSDIKALQAEVATLRERVGEPTPDLDAAIDDYLNEEE